MSEIEQDEQSSEILNVPIEWHISDTLPSHYAANVFVQPGQEEAEEREWDTLFAQPHVQAGLDRLADEAERQFAAGETEEGGFTSQ